MVIDLNLIMRALFTDKAFQLRLEACRSRANGKLPNGFCFHKFGNLNRFPASFTSHILNVFASSRLLECSNGSQFEGHSIFQTEENILAIVSYTPSHFLILDSCEIAHVKPRSVEGSNLFDCRV